MNQQLSIPTRQSAPQITPVDPTSIAQSESQTAVILAIAILISILIGGVTGLVQVIMLTRSRH